MFLVSTHMNTAWSRAGFHCPSLRSTQRNDKMHLDLKRLSFSESLELQLAFFPPVPTAKWIKLNVLTALFTSF